MKKEKQLKFDKSYLKMCYVWAENSYAIRRKVGCLIVKDRMIISDGYNGTPAGFDNVCEDRLCTLIHKCVDKEKQCSNCCFSKLKTKPEVLHAEANALTKLAKSNNSSKGATLYVTCEPCFDCAKLIIQSEIKRVVYSEDYTKHDGIELLKKAGVIVDKIEVKC